MSIINEALKKTQNNIQKNSPATPNSSPEGQPGPQSGPKIGLIIVLFIVLAGGLIYLFSTSVKGKSFTFSISAPKRVQKAIQVKTPVAPAAVQTAQPVQPEAQASQGQNLVLNGIMTMDNEPFALINNQIYRVGDTVEGKKVVRIEDKKVELSGNGETIILSTGTENLAR